MPLNTQIQDRDGSFRRMRWGWWHVDCMFKAAEDEGLTEELNNHGEVMLEEVHQFEDPADGEIFVLPAGTVIRIWRSWK